MKEFTTNPLKWKVTGNIIGEELGTIRLIDNWGETPSRVDHGLTREIGGLNIRFARVEYMDLLYESGADVHMNVATGGDYLEDLTGVGNTLATVTLSDEWSIKGNYSFKAEWTDADASSTMYFLYQQTDRLPVSQGDEITFKIDYKSVEPFRQIIRWFNAEDGHLLNTVIVLPAAPNGGVGSVTGVAPAEAAYAYFAIYNTTTPVANTVYVDNVKIKTSNPAPYVPVVTVSSVVPGNGTENVPIDQSIVVTFDDNIEAGSAYANITVKNPGGTSMSINKTISGNKLTITGSWLNNILYTLTIPINGIKDFLAGLTTTFKTVPETPPPTQPALPVYGLYVNDTVTPNAVNELTVANLNRRGITDLFILTPLGSIDTRLNPWITKFGSSDIRLHAWVICFKDSNGWFNPNPSVEPTKLNTIKNHIQTIINDKNVDGINLDSVRYPGGGSLIANKHNGTYHVTNFVEDIKDRIDTHNDVTGANQILLSTCLMPETDWSNKYYYGQSYSDHAEHTDFIAPMVYGYDYNFGEGGIEGRTAYIKEKSGKNNTVSTITTYKGDKDTTPLSLAELNNDIDAVEAGGSRGYILFRHGLVTIPTVNLTIAQIDAAANTVENYYGTNSKLPATVTIDSVDYTMGQFMYLLLTAVVNLNTDNTDPITVNDTVNNPPNPSTDRVSGNYMKADYLSDAEYILNFIDTNNRLPNYRDSTLGRIGFTQLVIAFINIVTFYVDSSPNRLPNYAVLTGGS